MAMMAIKWWYPTRHDMNPQEETKPEGFVSKVEVPWCAINGRETTRQKWGKLLEETGENVWEKWGNMFTNTGDVQFWASRNQKNKRCEELRTVSQIGSPNQRTRHLIPCHWHTSLHSSPPTMFPNIPVLSFEVRSASPIPTIHQPSSKYTWVSHVFSWSENRLAHSIPCVSRIISHIVFQ